MCGRSTPRAPLTPKQRIGEALLNAADRSYRIVRRFNSAVWNIGYGLRYPAAR